MRLTLQNHIVCADYGQVHLDARVVGQIINYTAETWQPDRPKKERECNIEQGKIAEESHRTIYSSVLFSGVVFENLR